VSILTVQTPAGLRTFSLNQRLCLETTPYGLRELEPFRRKSLSHLNNNTSNQLSNTNVPALEYDYKPNVPQIQGKITLAH
jgi:hypothetical protein